MKRLLLVAIFLEIGLLLIFLPWSPFWDRNYFAQALPGVRALVTNNFLRGAVSGLGVVNVYVGLAELLAVIVSRPVDRPTTPFGAAQSTSED